MIGKQPDKHKIEITYKITANIKTVKKNSNPQKTKIN